MKDSEIFELNGFTQCFPHISSYIKNVTPILGFNVRSGYTLKRGDRVEKGSECGLFYYKVTKINLPYSEVKIYKNIEDVIEYVNEKESRKTIREIL